MNSAAGALIDVTVPVRPAAPVTCTDVDRRHGFDLRMADAGQPDGFTGFGSSAVSPKSVANRIHNAVTCAFLRLKHAGK
jgi:hypothetical protein